MKCDRAFIAEWQLDCPRAQERLLKSGVPGTTEVRTHAEAGGAAIFSASATILTAKDALMLEERDVDAIQPLIADVMNAVTQVPNLPADVDLSKLREWLQNLNSMRATERISDDQARQLRFDLDTTNEAMYQWLKSQERG